MTVKTEIIQDVLMPSLKKKQLVMMMMTTITTMMTTMMIRGYDEDDEGEANEGRLKCVRCC